MRKQVLKYMFIFLAFAALISIIVANGCSTAQNSTPAASQNSAGPDGQSAQPPSGMPARPGTDSIAKSVLPKVADELGVSVESLTQAYEDAKSTSIPPAPPGVDIGSESPGGTAPFMPAIFDKMSKKLNIPADRISAAWSKALAGLNSTSGPQR